MKVFASAYLEGISNDEVNEEQEWSWTLCYQKVRIIGLKLYHYQLALKLLYWHLVNCDFY